MSMPDIDLLDIAVVVPSIAVNDLLVRCLEDCQCLFPGVDLLAVVDDVEGAERLEGVARVIRSTDPSIAAKRNLGVHATTGSYVAFIDSDAWPSPGWLTNAVRLLESDPELGAVGGPNISPPDQQGWERAVGLAHRSPLVDGWWRFRKDPSARPRDVRALPTCNLIVRRSDFDALGGMNEALFTAEDTDFCARLVRSGKRIHFSPDVRVFHKDRNIESFAVQRFTFGVAIVPLVRRGQPPDSGYLLMSVVVAAFVLFLLSAPLGVISRRWVRLWRRGMILYLSVLVFESARLSGGPAEMPRVFTALAVGNLGPGVGALMRLLRLSPDLHGLYRNDP